MFTKETSPLVGECHTASGKDMSLDLEDQRDIHNFMPTDAHTGKSVRLSMRLTLSTVEKKCSFRLI